MFGQFLENVFAITKCPLYSMSAIDRFDCIKVPCCNIMLSVNQAFCSLKVRAS